MSENGLSLGQLILQVRRELEWAHEVDAEHPLRFGVDVVELDVAVDVTSTTSGGGGLNLKVFGVGASGEASRESATGSTTTIHLVLRPRDSRSVTGRFEVSADDTEHVALPSPEANLGDSSSGALDTENRSADQ